MIQGQVQGEGGPPELYLGTHKFHEEGKKLSAWIKKCWVLVSDSYRDPFRSPVSAPVSFFYLNVTWIPSFCPLVSEPL